MWKFQSEIDISYNVFHNVYFLLLTLSYSCAGPKWALSSSAPFSFLFAETFLTLQFSRTISRALQFLFGPRSWSERAPCWFLHQYRVLSRNCKQPTPDEFQTKADTSSESKNLNRTIIEILNSPQKRYFEADIGFQNWRKELYPRVHLWMPIFIGTLKKYGETQHWTLNKNVEGRHYMNPMEVSVEDQMKK